MDHGNNYSGAYRPGAIAEGLRGGGSLSRSSSHRAPSPSPLPRPSSHRQSSIPTASITRTGSGTQAPANARWGGTAGSGYGTTSGGSYSNGTDVTGQRTTPDGKQQTKYLDRLTSLASGLDAHSLSAHNQSYSSANTHGLSTRRSGEHIGTVVLNPPSSSMQQSSSLPGHRLTPQSIMASRNNSIPSPSITPCHASTIQTTSNAPRHPHSSTDTSHLRPLDRCNSGNQSGSYQTTSSSPSSRPRPSRTSLDNPPPSYHFNSYLPHTSVRDDLKHPPTQPQSSSQTLRQTRQSSSIIEQQSQLNGTSGSASVQRQMGSSSRIQGPSSHAILTTTSSSGSGSSSRDLQQNYSGLSNSGLSNTGLCSTSHYLSAQQQPDSASRIREQLLQGSLTGRGRVERDPRMQGSLSSRSSDDSMTNYPPSRQTRQYAVQQAQQHFEQQQQQLQQQIQQQQQQQQQQGQQQQHHQLQQSRLPSLQSAGLVGLPKQAGCVGLQNNGNTCYMNSMLQLMNAVPELVAWCYMEARQGGGITCPSKANVANAYTQLVTQMWSSQQSVVNPSKFMHSMGRLDSRWDDGSQQDSQEFMHALLEALQAESNRAAAKPKYRQLEGKGTEAEQAEEAWQYARTWNNSVVDDVFGGMLQSTLKCENCKRESHCFEPFIDLALPIPAPSKGHTTLENCLEAFFAQEDLQGSESYKCESCKRSGRHHKAMQLWHPPPVLLLCLKRFSQKAGASLFSRFRSTTKNNASVELEQDALDLSRFCNPTALRAFQPPGRRRGAPVYKLIGVSHHSGSLEGGHYTASARSAADGSWYSFNDSIVRQQAARLDGSSAYVLVYRLVHPNSSVSCM